jgi:hypothetical protein
MGPRKRGSQTLLERVLALLEERFPWLGSGRDEPIAGSGDSIDVPPDLDTSAVQKRDKERPDDGDPES